MTAKDDLKTPCLSMMIHLIFFFFFNILFYFSKMLVLGKKKKSVLYKITKICGFRRVPWTS